MDARRRRQRGRAARAAPDGWRSDRLDRPDAAPGAFEAVTRQMVESLSDDLREIRSRVESLVWMIAGAILLDTALRVMGT
jgi:phage terminase large subunit-like protein